MTSYADSILKLERNEGKQHYYAFPRILNEMNNLKKYLYDSQWHPRNYLFSRDEAGHCLNLTADPDCVMCMYTNGICLRGGFL